MCVCSVVCVYVYNVCSVVCMCALKQLLFGELLTVRSCYKPKLHWRDAIVKDIQGFGFYSSGLTKVVQYKPVTS